MSKTSFAGASAEEKVLLLGQEFRNIEVTDGVCFTTIVLEGEAFTLVGNPQEALRTFLGCRANATQH